MLENLLPFTVHERFGEHPRVYLIGFSHGKEMHQKREMVDFLKGFVKPGDSILLEGDGYYEVKLSTYHGNDFIGNLKETLLEKGAKLYRNDDIVLGIQAMTIAGRKNLVPPDAQKNYDVQLTKFLEMRDRKFCFHPTLGIIPLYQKNEGRIIQMVGRDHILAGNISRHLRDTGISYVALKPEPSHQG